MQLFLLVLAALSSNTASASTIHLRHGQQIPYGEHTVSCGEPSLAKPCEIDLEKQQVRIGGIWAGATDAGFPIRDLIEIAQLHEKAGRCYGIILK